MTNITHVKGGGSNVSENGLTFVQTPRYRFATPDGARRLALLQ